MPIANLANVPDSPDTWSQYTFSLQATLDNICDAILRQKNIYIPRYELDPLNLTDPNAQLFQLQDMVNGVNSVLGISGFNYLDVDINDQNELASWVFLLETNLKQACQLTGVS